MKTLAIILVTIFAVKAFDSYQAKAQEQLERIQDTAQGVVDAVKAY